MLEPYGKTTKFKNIDSKTANQLGFYFRINGQNCKIMTYKGNEEKVIILLCGGQFCMGAVFQTLLFM